MLCPMGEPAVMGSVREKGLGNKETHWLSGRPGELRFRVPPRKERRGM